MLVFFFSFGLGLEGGHVDTFWPPLCFRMCCRRLKAWRQDLPAHDNVRASVSKGPILL